ncbi:E3 ubiquitin-protein ligase RNFT1, partial [Camellia lanceoleosa]
IFWLQFGFFVVMFKSNDIFCRTTRWSLKIPILIGISFVFGLHVIVVYWWHWNDDILYPLIMVPPKAIPHFWHAIFIIMVNDTLVRQAAMVLKCTLLMYYKNSRGFILLPIINFLYLLLWFILQGQMLTLVEYLLLLYRALLPTPVWYRFFLNKEYGSLCSSLITRLYLTFKLTSVVEKEKMHAPLLLCCKHIFCEDCVSEWFERERSCPLCRALVKPADLRSFGDGSTSLFCQFFVTNLDSFLVMFKSNDILRKQTALKGERKIPILIGISFVFGLHVIVVYWWYWNDDILYPLIMVPPKAIPPFWHAIFIIMVNVPCENSYCLFVSNTLVRQAAMVLKCILLMYYKNSRGQNCRRQYRFFLNKQYGSLFSSLMTGLYQTFKLTSVVEKVQSFFAALKALSHKESHYGAYATSEQKCRFHSDRRSSNHYLQVVTKSVLFSILIASKIAPSSSVPPALRQDTLVRQAAMVLKCILLMYYKNNRGRNYCRQGQMLTLVEYFLLLYRALLRAPVWFERERTCPLCRALVKHADLRSFGDGSTSLFF